MCHVSHITCSMCHVIFSFYFFLFDKMVEMVRGGSVINGVYPVSFYRKVPYPFLIVKFVPQIPQGCCNKVKVPLARIQESKYPLIPRHTSRKVALQSGLYWGRVFPSVKGCQPVNSQASSLVTYHVC